MAHYSIKGGDLRDCVPVNQEDYEVVIEFEHSLFEVFVFRFFFNIGTYLLFLLLLFILLLLHNPLLLLLFYLYQIFLLVVKIEL